MELGDPVWGRRLGWGLISRIVAGKALKPPLQLGGAVGPWLFSACRAGGEGGAAAWWWVPVGAVTNCITGFDWGFFTTPILFKVVCSPPRIQLWLNLGDGWEGFTLTPELGSGWAVALACHPPPAVEAL